MTSFLIAVPQNIEDACELHNYLKLPEYFYDYGGVTIPADHIVTVVWSGILQQQYLNEAKSELSEWVIGLAQKRLAQFELHLYPDNIPIIYKEADKIVKEFVDHNSSLAVYGLNYSCISPLEQVLASGKPFKNIPYIKSSS